MLNDTSANPSNLDETQDQIEYASFTRNGLKLIYGAATIAWCLLIGALFAYL